MQLRGPFHVLGWARVGILDHGLHGRQTTPCRSLAFAVLRRIVAMIPVAPPALGSSPHVGYPLSWVRMKTIPDRKSSRRGRRAPSRFCARVTGAEMRLQMGHFGCQGKGLPSMVTTVRTLSPHAGHRKFSGRRRGTSLVGVRLARRGPCTSLKGSSPGPRYLGKSDKYPLDQQKKTSCIPTAHTPPSRKGIPHGRTLAPPPVTWLVRHVR